MIAGENPDLLLLDLFIPKRGGFEILAEYRADAGPAVIVLSGSDSPMHRERARELGAREYIVKSMHFEEWEQALHGALERHMAQQPTIEPSKSYRLNSGLTAVSPGQDLVRIPSGAVVRVADGPLDETMFVDVIWQDKKVVLFKSDLERRATQVMAASATSGTRENRKDKENAGLSAVSSIPTNTSGSVASETTDHVRILNVLKSELETANKNVREASTNFDQVIREVPSGIHPDSTLRIQNVSRALSDARQALLEAHLQLSAFVTQGIIPDHLKKGVEREQRSGDVRKIAG
jgi:hypothetical protein